MAGSKLKSSVFNLIMCITQPHSVNSYTARCIQHDAAVDNQGLYM